MALIETASIDLSSVDVLEVTFEASLFADSLTADKPVTGLGSMNIVAPKSNPDNLSVVRAAGPVFSDHDDVSAIAAGSIRCTCAVKPTADMSFHVIVVKK